MKNIIIIFTVCFSYHGILKAQESNYLSALQNPNYEISLKKYDSLSNVYALQQGTTLQKTYKAIDPLEEKRQLRAQRPLWRHQRALERARNTRSYVYGYDSYYSNGFNNYGYNHYNDISIPFSIGLGLLDVALWSNCYW